MTAASALHAGCDTLCSEDMQHGMKVDKGLRIVNPFRGVYGLRHAWSSLTAQKLDRAASG
jgi:hypothetical protein